MHERRGVIALGIGSLLALLFPVGASAQTAETSQMRVAQLSPDLQGVVFSDDLTPPRRAAAADGTADHSRNEWWRVPAMIAAALVLTAGLVMRVRAGRTFTRRRD